jgi:hypothetical protein
VQEENDNDDDDDKMKKNTFLGKRWKKSKSSSSLHTIHIISNLCIFYIMLAEELFSLFVFFKKQNTKFIFLYRGSVVITETSERKRKMKHS